MKNVKYLALLLVCIAGNVNAQKVFNNSVKLHSASFSIPNFRFIVPTRLLGASVERKLSKKFSVSLGYFQWRREIGGRFKTEIAEYPYKSDTTPGAIIARIGYAMIDMSAFYNLNIYKLKHFLKFGTGISYTWGTNMCVEHRRYYNPDHGGWGGANYYEKVAYWGIVPQLSYDFFFLKNRLNLGLDVRGRYYLDVPNNQYDIGIHLGVNF